MGYRDDETALAARRDYLAGEVAALRSDHDELTRHGAELTAILRRKRWKLRLRLTLRWIRRHPKLVFCLALAVSIIGYTQINELQEARAHRRHVARVLGKNCATRLRVVSQPKAQLFIGDLQVGRTPLNVPICPGPYLVRLAHDKMIPWQRRVVVDQRPQQRLNASLVPWNPSLRPRDGILVESRPTGALAFVEGREIGRTPLLLRESMVRRALRRRGRKLGKRPTALVGVAAAGHRPFAKRIPLSGNDLWVALRPIEDGSKGKTLKIRDGKRTIEVRRTGR